MSLKTGVQRIASAVLRVTAVSIMAFIAVMIVWCVIDFLTMPNLQDAGLVAILASFLAEAIKIYWEAYE